MSIPTLWSIDLLTAQSLASATPGRAKSRSIERRDGGAVIIPIMGPMLQTQEAQDRFGASGLMTSDIRDAVATAAADADVGGILLHVSSGGGDSMGVSDLASEVTKAAQRKPVYAFIENIGASAAFWAIAGASRISANRSAMIGSIGTFAVAIDSSAMAGAMGLSVRVIKAGSLKGMGVFGAPISDQQIEGLQSIVTATNEIFLGDVSRGRRLSGSALEKVSDAQVYVGAGAKAVGLVDAIESYDEALAALKSQIARGGYSPQRSFTPPAQASAPQPTSNILPSVPSAQPQPVERRSQLMSNDPSEIVSEFQLRCAAHQQRHGGSKFEAAVAVSKSHPQLHAKYVQAVQTVTGAGASAEMPGAVSAAPDEMKAIDAEVDKRIESVMRGRTMPRSKAIAIVFSNDPTLHQRYLSAHNGGRPVGRP